MKPRIPIASVQFLGREREYVDNVMARRELSMGRFVEMFETQLSGVTRNTYSVATASGTAALHAALLVLGLEPGQRVVIPATTYIATANAVRYCGGIPVVVDVYPETWTMDVDQAERAVRDYDAVGVIAVDLYGVQSGIPQRRNGLRWILVDACESIGIPPRDGVDAAVYSFYGNKIVVCGEGGAVVTNSHDVARQCRLIRGQGQGERRYWHETLGYNYRMTDLQAAVGCGQLETLREHLERRHAIRALYDEMLPTLISRQARPLGSVDWVMPVSLHSRDLVAERMYAHGIETRPVFPSVHTQPALDTVSIAPYGTPVATQLQREGLLLPLHLGMNASDVRDVCSVWGVA